MTLDGTDLLALSEAEAREIRGARMAMIFQDPMRSLNPVLTIGRQLTEVLHRHQKLAGAAARRRAVELLETVGIPMAEKRLGAYPHQFSGGMRQRVMIAIALSCNPRLLIADEATTALDVTIQAQIIDLVKTPDARARHVGDLDQPRPRRGRRPVRSRQRHVCRDASSNRGRSASCSTGRAMATRWASWARRRGSTARVRAA